MMVPVPKMAAPMTFVCASSDVQELVASILSQSGEPAIQPIAPSKLDGLATELQAHDVLILDLDGLAGRALPAHLNRERVVVLCERDLPSVVDLLVEHDRLCHVLTKSSSLLGRQLSSTIMQLRDYDMDVLGYLSPEGRVERHVITSSESKRACVERVHALADELDAFSEFPDVAATVATELLMNAMFNAPVELASGNPKYKDRPRGEDLTLGAAETVRLEIGRDDKVLVLRIEDNFGSLDRPTLVENLNRSSHTGRTQIKMKTAGAGIGLYMVLSSTNQLDFVVTPGISTRVTAVLALTKRYKDFERLGSSVNFLQRT